MATLSHEAFRRIVARFGGCDEYFTEMINADKTTSKPIICNINNCKLLIEKVENLQDEIEAVKDASLFCKDFDFNQDDFGCYNEDDGTESTRIYRLHTVYM